MFLLCAPLQTGAAAREGQTRDQLRTLQGKLLGVVAENDALRAVATMLVDDLQQAQAAVTGSGVTLASAFLSDESAKHAVDCLLNCREDTHVEDLDSFAEGLEQQQQQQDEACSACAYAELRVGTARAAIVQPADLSRWLQVQPAARALRCARRTSSC
jgi:hypothetical protein